MNRSIELLNPAGLWMLTALAPLVLLYILKIKRQRLAVSSTWLWSEAQRDLLAKSPFKRLMVQLSLVLQILALILLSLALARPSTRGRSIVGDHVALVIDTSASMSALDSTGKPRIDLAKQAAIETVAALSPGADAMILEAGRDARVASTLDRDTRRLTLALRQISAADVEGDLGSAVALAADRLRQLGGSRRVMVFTDGALARADSLANINLALEVVKVGSPIDNAAIVRVDVRSGNDPALGVDQVQAFVMIVNYGKSQRDVFVTMREQNASDVLASRRVLLKPGERTPVVLTFNPATGDIGQGLVIEMSPHDAMAVDDVAYGRVPSGARLPVVLAVGDDRSSPWIERALRSDPFVELLKAPAADPSSIGIPVGALVVVHGACPTQTAAYDLLLVDPPQGNCLGATVGPIVDSPVVTSWTNADQRFRFLTLDGVHVARARRLQAESARQELVHAREGTIIADVSSPGRTATLIGFDVGESDWPLKASFVLFMRNVVELARAHRAHGVWTASRAGEPVRLAVPPQVTQVQVQDPAGIIHDVPARNGLAVVSDTHRAGVYHGSWAGPGAASVSFAINLTSELESDVADRPLVLNTQAGPVVTTADKLADAHVEWTWLAASIALAFVLADIFVLTRRSRVRQLTEPLRPRAPERRPA
jgi:hypothetical protein